MRSTLRSLLDPIPRPRVLLALVVTALVVGPGRRDERGDVPGWVLVTVMTVGLVGAISGVAKDQLTAMLSQALASVK